MYLHPNTIIQPQTEHRDMNSVTMFPVHLATTLKDTTAHQLFQMIQTDRSANSRSHAREGAWKEHLLRIALTIFNGL